MYSYASAELHALHFGDASTMLGLVESAVQVENEDKEDVGSVAELDFMDENDNTLAVAMRERVQHGRLQKCI